MSDGGDHRPTRELVCAAERDRGLFTAVQLQQHDARSEEGAKGGMSEILIPSGFLTSRQRFAISMKAAKRALLNGVVTDDVALATRLAAGQTEWRHYYMHSDRMGPFYSMHLLEGHHDANHMFNFLKAVWVEKHPEWPNPSVFLDSINVPTPQTQEEIDKEVDDAWEIEIMSDERSMRKNYEGSARHRKGGDLGAKNR